MTRLKETSEECNLRNISHEDVILLIATIHCNKEELRKDIKRNRMHVNRKIDLELTSAWQKGRIEVLVSSDLDYDMLWGIKHLKEFRQISRGFPNTILRDSD